MTSFHPRSARFAGALGCATSALLAFAVAGCSESKKDAGGGGGAAGAPSVILDGGGEIPDPPDGAVACQSGSCNYQKQDCPASETCLPSDQPPAAGDWPPKCFPSGTKQAGESCTTWNDCVKGHFCAGVATGTPGTCRKLCCGGDWSACGADQSCIQQVYLVRPGETEPVYASADICVPVGGCDPLDPKSCTEAGRTCQIVDPLGHVACLKEGVSGAGAACSPEQPCKGGLICASDECRKLCKAVEGGGEPSCAAGEVCVHYNRDPAGVGECVTLD